MNFGLRTSMSVSAMSVTAALATSSTTRMIFAPGIPGLTWVFPTMERRPSRTAFKNGTGTFGLRDVQPKVAFLTAAILQRHYS